MREAAEETAVDCCSSRGHRTCAWVVDSRQTRLGTTSGGGLTATQDERTIRKVTTRQLIAAAILSGALIWGAGAAGAQTDCLSCHSDPTMQDAAGHSLSVDGKTFSSSIHGSLKCNDCHSDIKGYPHPDKIAPVKCETCHADAESALTGSVHASASVHPCTSCHGNAHTIFPKTDARSAVYPLNIPRTCGACHGNDKLAKDHHLSNVVPNYLDSIHGSALSTEGLLVAANCESCHGSHHILSHKDPSSSTYRTNIPATCGSCHAKIAAEYASGAHGHALAKGDSKAPVCTDCHTAHAIQQPEDAEFRARTAPLCGSCHAEKASTYRDTFHSQLSMLGGYVDTARCWDCHRAHEVLPASDPRSTVAPANLVHTCGQCHTNANARFVKYQPHADASNWKMNLPLYLIRLFMNLLLVSVLTFFLIHTILWIFRARIEQVRNKTGNGGKNA